MTEHMEWEDRITQVLTNLYRSYGYSRYRMEKFEPYELYMANKNYLQGGVIAFPDNTGKLMALKPDVTMSVVRNTRAEEKEKKVYYSENVFRMERDTQEYREIRQIGLEYIGGGDGYPEAETLLLAAESLKCLGRDFALCLSHADLVQALLEGCIHSEAELKVVLQALRRHRPYSIAELQLPELVADSIRTLITLPGDAREALACLRSMKTDREIRPIVQELETVVEVLEQAGFAANVKIDFSILNDTDYYNGISFVGYLDGIPKAVLAGGRYNNLMQRLGKNQGGIGFALYLGELIRSFAAPAETDADILLLYGSQPACRVLERVRAYTEQGFTVRAAAEFPEGFRAGRVIELQEENK
ncbi:MAG: ATP phosphoribosyltransferase regulatory subunit [Oscillospiraceae bacterium]|nr:ATP phosphoribosyltransferase regulatory subunit [Oscillospiraceae bacterium]